MTDSNLTELLAVLTPRQRRAIELKAAGCSRLESATLMGVSPLRVRNLLSEGRRRLLDGMPPRVRKFYETGKSERRKKLYAFPLDSCFNI